MTIIKFKKGDKEYSNINKIISKLDKEIYRKF